MRLRNLSLRVKFTAIALAIGLLSFAVSFMVSYRDIIIDHREHLTEEALIIRSKVMDDFKAAMVFKDHAWLQVAMYQLMEYPHVKELRVFNAKGNEIFPVRYRGGERLVTGILRTGESRSFEKTLGEETVNTFVFPLENGKLCQICHDQGNRVQGALILSLSLDDMREDVISQGWHYASLFGLAAIVISLGSILAVNSLFLIPLRRIREGTRAVERGDFLFHIPPDSGDEIGLLTEDFNKMSLNLTAFHEKQDRYLKEILSLSRTSAAISSELEAKNVYRSICEALIHEFGLARVWIRETGGGTPDGLSHQHCGLGIYCGILEQGAVSMLEAHAPLLLDVEKRVFEDRAPYTAENVELRIKGHAGDGDFSCRSVMALPLLTNSGILRGVMTLCSDDPYFFTEDRQNIFRIFSNHSAIAIDNCLLFDDLEKKSAELKEHFNLLSRSQAEWIETFDSIKDMIALLDVDMTITRVNKAFREYFSPAEPMGKKCHEVLGESLCLHSPCPHETAVSTGYQQTRELYDKDRSRVLEISFFPYLTGKHAGSIIVAKDITEKKESEMRMMLSERLALLGQMSSGIAHEINNPLATIKTCAEGISNRLKRGECATEVMTNYLRIINEEVTRCKEITDSMLSFVRTGSKKDIVDINSVLDRSLELVRFQGRLKNVDIERRYAEGSTLFAREGELKQLFLSIIVNALDAMEDRGRLTLETETHDKKIFVRISDTGPGIPPEFLQKIFEPFYTGHAEKGGTGLGLSIAKKIVAGYNGEIEVRSETGKGTVFTITIPA